MSRDQEHKSFSDIRKQVLGNNSRFQLIDTELCESRLYFASARFSALTGDHIARMLMLSNIVLFMLTQEDPALRSYAEKYALKTVQFGRYAVFRTHATDIYALCYAVLHPEGESVFLRDGADGVRHLQSLNFDAKMHIEFLRRIAGGTQTSSLATSYFHRLELQLGIQDGRYRIWRRQAAIWSETRASTKAKMIKFMLAEARRLGGGAGRNAEMVKNGLLPLAQKYINTTESAQEQVEIQSQPPAKQPSLHQRWSRS